jgi:hypothetical protein
MLYTYQNLKPADIIPLTYHLKKDFFDCEGSIEDMFMLSKPRHHRHDL